MIIFYLYREEGSMNWDITLLPTAREKPATGKKFPSLYK